MNLVTKAGAALFLLASLASPLKADDALSLAANHAFLAGNAAKPGVSVLADGLQFRVLKSGFGGHPGPADMVEFAYTTRLIDGKVVDSASSDLPANQQVSNLMRGLNEALLKMQVGDRWELAVPASLAFGDKGNALVPPGQTLVFDITLMAVMPPAAAQTQDESPLSVYSFGRGTEHQAGAMFTIKQ